MISKRWQPTRLATAVLAILLTAGVATAQSISMDYCSTINTGTTPGNYSDWQSDGLCSNFCKADSYALAIVQGNLCWCSNILPGTSLQVSLSKCEDPCPGFPSDVCGGSGTWGYMRLGANPLTSTASAGGSQSTTATPQTAATTRHATPSVATVTADGTVKTVTVVPTAADTSTSIPGSAESTSGNGSGGSGGIGTGASVGIAIGGVAILAIGGAIAFIFVRRKRRREQEEMFDDGRSPRGSGAAMAYAPRSADGATSSRGVGRRPTNGTWGSDHSSGKRSSMLMPSDPRMNPAPGFYGRPDMNKSHDSFLSMQDNRDYSRPVHEPPKVLKVTNAGPDDID